MGVARTVRAHTSSRKPGLGQSVLERMVAREVWHWLALNSSVDSGIRTVLSNHYSTPTQPRKEEEKEGTRRTFQGLQKNRGGLIEGLSVAHPSKALNAHRVPKRKRSSDVTGRYVAERCLERCVMESNVQHQRTGAEEQRTRLNVHRRERASLLGMLP